MSVGGMSGMVVDEKREHRPYDERGRLQCGRQGGRQFGVWVEDGEYGNMEKMREAVEGGKFIVAIDGDVPGVGLGKNVRVSMTQLIDLIIGHKRLCDKGH